MARGRHHPSARLRVAKPRPSDQSAKVSVFAGDSSRVWHAQRTCQRSGAAFETTYAGPSLLNLILKLIGAGSFFAIAWEIFH